jgi:hypothetical protein
VQSVRDVKRQGRDADHWSPSSSEVKNDRAIPSLSHTSSRLGAWWIKPRDSLTFALHTSYDGIYGEHWYKLVLLTSIYRQGFLRVGRGHTRIDPIWIEMSLIHRYAIKARQLQSTRHDGRKVTAEYGNYMPKNYSVWVASWCVRPNPVRHASYWPTFAAVKLPQILCQRCFEKTQKCYGTDGKPKSFDARL